MASVVMHEGAPVGRVTRDKNLRMDDLIMFSPMQTGHSMGWWSAALLLIEVEALLRWSGKKRG